MAEDIAEKTIVNERVGNGFDSHRFENGDGLMLGGVKVPYHKSFLAHSDGDIIIHALIDSMFGAVSLGDIGDHFPDTDMKWLNISGKELFEIAYNKVLKKGFSLKQIDIVVIMEEPKLSEYKPDIILICQHICRTNVVLLVYRGSQIINLIVILPDFVLHSHHIKKPWNP